MMLTNHDCSLEKRLERGVLVSHIAEKNIPRLKVALGETDLFHFAAHIHDPGKLRPEPRSRN